VSVPFHDDTCVEPIPLVTENTTYQPSSMDCGIFLQGLAWRPRPLQCAHGAGRGTSRAG
jgi:hypothetical protein